MDAEPRPSSGGRYQITDLGSRNGTFVNGTRVNHAELNAGDIVAIGHAIFRLVGGELVEYVDDGRAASEPDDLSERTSYPTLTSYRQWLAGAADSVRRDGMTFALEPVLHRGDRPRGRGRSPLLQLKVVGAESGEPRAFRRPAGLNPRPGVRTAVRLPRLLRIMARLTGEP